jgi:type VI secretion system secreted protein Hcp
MSVDMYLEFIPDANIKGEAIDNQYGPNGGDCIQIDSFDFGGELPVSTEQGTGLGAGKVKYNEFNFKMKSSRASPFLFKAMYRGAHISWAILHLRKSAGAEGGTGGGQKEYMAFKFKELMVSKYSIDGGSEDPVESISFAYTGMYMGYKVQDKTGALGSKLDGGWDVKATTEWLGDGVSSKAKDNIDS